MFLSSLGGANDRDFTNDTPVRAIYRQENQPVFPLRAAFYYPWFPEAWEQQGIFPYTQFTPTQGYYDTSDIPTIQQNIAAMQYGHIQAGIASWWGQGTRTDNRISTLLSAATGTGFYWSIYHEQEGQGDPTVGALSADLAYLLNQYGNHPNFLKIDNRIVVFVYAQSSDGCGMSDRWKLANTVNAYIVLKVFPGYKNCANQPDGWHQYAPAKAADGQGAYSYSISPGFWKAGESPRLERDLFRWYQNIRDMIASGADFQLVTTFNEWGEGTIVESADEWASASGYGAYLDALHQNGQIYSVYMPLVYSSSGAVVRTALTSTDEASQGTLQKDNPSTPSNFPWIRRVYLPLINSPPAPPPSQIVLAAGDIADCYRTDDEVTAGLVAAYPGTVLTLGDNVYETGTTAEFLNCYHPSWGQHKARTRPSVGNHEYLTSGAAGYFGYFGAAAGHPTKGYYSFNLGDWHIIALNSNCSKIGGCDADSAQVQWLQADLAANPKLCTLAYWHHPRFSSGSHGSHTWLEPIWQVLYAAGVDVVLNGHDHHYERFDLQNPYGVKDPSAGIREFVVGTGGKSLYSVDSPIANSQVIDNDTFGILKLDLQPASYTWEFIPEPGASFSDSGATNCH